MAKDEESFIRALIRFSIWADKDPRPSTVLPWVVDVIREMKKVSEEDRARRGTPKITGTPDIRGIYWKMIADGSLIRETNGRLRLREDKKR